MMKKLMVRWSVVWLILLVHISANIESDVLHSLRTNLQDPNNELKTWDSSHPNPCTWFHVICNNDFIVERLDLGNSALSGLLVPQLGLLKNLKYLELYNNNFSGAVPDDLGNLSNLESLDLYMNNFTGPIPETLGRLSKLRRLRLNNNSFTGPIPMSLTNLASLQVLDLSNNQLSGVVPDNGSFSLFTPISFDNNLKLRGLGIGPPCLGLPVLSPSPPYVPQPRGGYSMTVVVIAGGVSTGAAILSAALASAIALWCRSRIQELYFDVPEEEDPEVYLGQLKRFSLRELQVATDNFSKENIVGTGGFSKVYRGRLADGSLVAVKRLKDGRTPGGELQFQSEVEMIKRQPNEPPLNWLTRKHIALGSAQGLSYLHDHCDPKIILRDVKAANILLDDEFEAVVGDYGMVKLMNHNDTHVTTSVCGTMGHIAPEYISTGKLTEKIDVYGYGITLLELITGQKAFDLARFAKDNDVLLLDWVIGLLKEKKFETMVDPNMQSIYIESEVEQLIQISVLCTQRSSMDRPKMSEVVRMLKGDGLQLAEKWDEWLKAEAHRQDVELAPHPIRALTRPNIYTRSSCPVQAKSPS